MPDYLIDTNHAGRLMANDPALVERLRLSEAVGDVFAISMTVVGELHYAVYASRRQAANRWNLLRLLDAIRIYPFDRSSAEEFGRIQAEQKEKGRPIPPMDAQIAAVARQYALTVLTADKHFGLIDGIQIENWLAE